MQIPAQPREKRAGSDQVLLYDPGTYNAEDNAPYLIISALSATIPQLLDIADQYDPFQEGSHMGEVVFFPRQLLIMKWIEFWDPENYQVQGYLDGVREPVSWDNALKILGCEGGFTLPDKMRVTDAILTQHDLDAMYQCVSHFLFDKVTYTDYTHIDRDIFMPRGMLYSSFFALVQAAEAEATHLQQHHIHYENRRRQLNAPFGSDMTSLPIIPDNEHAGQGAFLLLQPGDALASILPWQVRAADNRNLGPDPERSAEPTVIEACVKEYKEDCRLQQQQGSDTQASVSSTKSHAVHIQDQGTFRFEDASVPMEDGQTPSLHGAYPSTPKQTVIGTRLSPGQTHHTITGTRALFQPKGPYTRGKTPAHIRQPNPATCSKGSPPSLRRRSSRTLRCGRSLETQVAAAADRNSDDDDDEVLDNYNSHDPQKPGGMYVRRRLARPVYRGPPATRGMAVDNPFLDGDEYGDDQLAADSVAQYLAGSQPQQTTGASHVAGPIHDHNSEQAEASAIMGQQPARQRTYHNTDPVIQELSREDYALMVQQLQQEYESFHNELLSTMSPARAEAQNQLFNFDAEQSLAVMGIVPASNPSAVAGVQTSGRATGLFGNPSTPGGSVSAP